MKVTASGHVDLGGRRATVLPSALRDRLAEAARLLEEAGQPGALELSPAEVRPGPRPGTVYLTRRAEERILAAAARAAAVREEQERAARREAAAALVAAAQKADPARWAIFEAAPRAAQEAVARLRRPDGCTPTGAHVATAYLWPERLHPGMTWMLARRLQGPIPDLDPAVAAELAALVERRAILAEEWQPALEKIAAGASPAAAAEAARAERKAREAAELEAEYRTFERMARAEFERALAWARGLDEPLRSILLPRFEALAAERGLDAAGVLGTAQTGIQRALGRGYTVEELLEACGGPEGLWTALQEQRRPFFHYEAWVLYDD